MTIGEHINMLRKKSNLSQAELGKKIGTSGDVIGRYERSLITPSIDVIIKMADAFNVSIDYLVGKTNLEIDTNTLKRLEDIQTLNEEGKTFIFNIIDMALRDYKAKETYKTN